LRIEVLATITQAMELNNSTVSPLRQRMIEDMVARKWVFRFMRAGERSEMDSARSQR
jgi:hypothetical protein